MSTDTPDVAGGWAVASDELAHAVARTRVMRHLAELFAIGLDLHELRTAQDGTTVATVTMPSITGPVEIFIPAGREAAVVQQLKLSLRMTPGSVRALLAEGEDPHSIASALGIDYSTVRRLGEGGSAQ